MEEKRLTRRKILTNGEEQEKKKQVVKIIKEKKVIKFETKKGNSKGNRQLEEKYE